MLFLDLFLRLYPPNIDERPVDELGLEAELGAKLEGNKDDNIDGADVKVDDSILVTVEELRLAVEELRLAVEELRVPEEELRLAVEELRVPEEELRVPEEELRLAVEELRVPEEELRLAVELALLVRTGAADPYPADPDPADPDPSPSVVVGVEPSPSALPTLPKNPLILF